MNPETKRFEREGDFTPEDWPRFAVGQIFVLNGVQCRVRKITNKDLILRPLRDQNPGPLGERPG